MFQRLALLLTTCLMCGASASAQAATYTEIGDAGGNTWCNGFCNYASAAELALAQSVTDPYTNTILGNVTPYNGDLFGFYYDNTQTSNLLVIDVVGPFYNGYQVATNEELLDGNGVSVNGWTGSNTTRLFAPVLPAGNYFLYFESYVDGPYSLTFNQYVSPLPTPPAVPLPAALPLFASGLGVMAWMGRRRKRMAAAEV
jgi:hypothetical protein